MSFCWLTGDEDSTHGATALGCLAQGTKEPAHARLATPKLRAAFEEPEVQQAVSEVSEIVSAAALELKAAPDQHLLPSNMASPFLLANLASCLQASGLSSCVRSASQQSTQRPLSTSVLSVVNHSHIIVRHPACPGTEIIVDPTFSEHFQLPVKDAVYYKFLVTIPHTFVGTGATLRAYVRTCCTAFHQALQRAELSRPPWREYTAQVNKYFPEVYTDEQYSATAIPTLSDHYTAPTQNPGAPVPSNTAVLNHQWLKDHNKKSAHNIKRSASGLSEATFSSITNSSLTASLMQGGLTSPCSTGLPHVLSQEDCFSNQSHNTSSNTSTHMGGFLATAIAAAVTVARAATAALAAVAAQHSRGNLPDPSQLLMAPVSRILRRRSGSGQATSGIDLSANAFAPAAGFAPAAPRAASVVPQQLVTSPSGLGIRSQSDAAFVVRGKAAEPRQVVLGFSTATASAGTATHKGSELKGQPAAAGVVCTGMAATGQQGNTSSASCFPASAAKEHALEVAMGGGACMEGLSQNQQEQQQQHDQGPGEGEGQHMPEPCLPLEPAQEACEEDLFGQSVPVTLYRSRASTGSKRLATSPDDLSLSPEASRTNTRGGWSASSSGGCSASKRSRLSGAMTRCASESTALCCLATSRARLSAAAAAETPTTMASTISSQSLHEIIRTWGTVRSLASRRPTTGGGDGQASAGGAALEPCSFSFHGRPSDLPHMTAAVASSEVAAAANLAAPILSAPTAIAAYGVQAAGHPVEAHTLAQASSAARSVSTPFSASAVGTVPSALNTGALLATTPGNIHSGGPTAPVLGFGGSAKEAESSRLQRISTGSAGHSDSSPEASYPGCVVAFHASSTNSSTHGCSPRKPLQAGQLQLALVLSRSNSAQASPRTPCALHPVLRHVIGHTATSAASSAGSTVLSGVPGAGVGAVAGTSTRFGHAQPPTSHHDPRDLDMLLPTIHKVKLCGRLSSSGSGPRQQQ